MFRIELYANHIFIGEYGKYSRDFMCLLFEFEEGPNMWCNYRVVGIDDV